MVRKTKFTYRALAEQSLTEKQKSPYNHGAICRIKLVDFMTYESVEVKAGPYLNLIIGPNGTGKSAIVCGIIIGLGGDSSLTGRAGTLGEYIRFNCDKAEVHIELYNENGKNFLIERRILFKKKNDTRSEWMLNGKSSQATEVKKFISGLNISIDNLCQFLPQERVVEFVKMNARELLKNTERAVGEPQTYEDHMQLIKLTNEMREIDRDCVKLQEQLETHKNVNLRLEKQVQIVQEKQKYEEEISWLEKKRPWVDYESSRLQFTESKKLLEKKEKELQKIQEKDAPIRNLLTVQKKKLFNLKQEMNSHRVRIQDEQLRSMIEHNNRLNDKRIEVQNAYQAKVRIRQESLALIDRLTNEVQMLEGQLQQLQQIESPDERVNEIDEQIQELRVRYREIESVRLNASEKRQALEYDLNSHNEQLRRLSEVQRVRFERLQHSNQKVYDAVSFYNKNKERFQGAIYLPYLVINVKNREYLSQVENAIPRRDLFSFVVEDPQDLKLFTDLLNERGIRVSCTLAPRRRLEDILSKRRHDNDFLAQYNLKYWLDELFTCPNIVKAYFCSQYWLHNIAAGDDKVNVQQLLSNNGGGINTFFVGLTRYDLRRSRFDNSLISSHSQISGSRDLQVMDEKQMAILKEKVSLINSELNATVKSLNEANSSMEELETVNNQLKLEKRKLLDSVNERKRTAQRIEVKKREIENRKNELIDLSVQREKSIKQLQELGEKQVNIMADYVKCVKETYQANQERVRSVLKFRCCERVVALAEKQLQEANLMNKTLLEEIEKLKQEIIQKKSEANQKYKLANKATGTDSTKPLAASIKKVFDTLPNTLDEIDQKLRNLILRMNALETDSDSNVIETYDKNVNMIKKTEEDLKQLTATHEIKKRERETLKQRWLEPLNGLIEKINENFEHFMNRLDCAGNVKLSTGANQENFEEYGITIYVRYRKNEQLKELSATHQSGGERSVATMVYMIALQELTKVPFRCVDEINQGMDDRFERSVFDLIVETASKSSSQYFLLTPKLLHDLNFTDKMQIHIVFNGPTLGLKWDNQAIYEEEDEQDDDQLAMSED